MKWKFIMICFLTINLLSCSSYKKSQITDEDLLSNSIEDFIKEYNSLSKTDKLEAITIYIDKKTFSMSSMPKEAVGTSISPKMLIGNYKTILFELYGVENLRDKTLLNSKKFNFTATKNSSDKISLEYDPILEIEYNHKKRIKKIKFQNSEIRNENWNFKVLR